MQPFPQYYRYVYINYFNMDTQEIWKDVKGYEGKYQVSNLGRVRSLDRIRWNGRGYCKVKGKLISQTIRYDKKRKCYTYAYVSFHTEHGVSSKKISVHRLVAEAFIPNPNDLPFVNHKDENKLNNNVNNLEWCTCEYNNKYGTAITRSANTRISNGVTKSVYKYTLDGKCVGIYNSVTEAAKANAVTKNQISNACVNKTIRVGNYGYRFEGDEYSPKKQTFHKNTITFYLSDNIVYECEGYENAAKFIGIAKDTFQCVVNGKRNSKKLNKYKVKIKFWKDGSERFIN